MPNSRRHRKSFNDPGHAHELTFSCYNGFAFFSAERTCRWLAESIVAARDELGFSLWAYVFMPEHVHLVVHFPQVDYDIAKLLKAVKTPVSRKALAFFRTDAPDWLPRLEQRRGERIEYHFWKRGGGYDRNITDPKTLETMIAYIHLSPVRRGLVERAKDWKWSSASWYINGQQPNSLTVDRIPDEWTVGMSTD